MGLSVRHIIRPLIAVTLCMALFSCVYDNYPEGEEPDSPERPAAGNGTYLYLDVRTLAQNALGNMGNNEMIDRVRFIIIGQNTEGQSVIEYNKLVDFLEESYTDNGSLGPVPSIGFSYGYTLKTLPGEKKIYVIANEESVDGLTIADNSGVTLPEGINSLSQLLASFSEGDNPEDLEDLLKVVYFTPDYSKMSKGTSIFLPYTTVYEANVEEKSATELLTVYLVPVATKIIFNFTNYRDEVITVEGLSLQSVNSASYLFADVGDKEITKDFWPLNIEEKCPEQYKDLYWTDWLAKIAEESQQNPGFSQNQDLNAKYGWIGDYSVPISTDLHEYIFITQANSQIIDAAQTDDTNSTTAGQLSLGPVYLAETNLNGSGNNGGVGQVYTLSMDLSSSTNVNQIPPFQNIEVSNLKALFRNTFVIVNITLKRGEI